MHLKVPDFTNPLVFLEIKVGLETGNFIAYFSIKFLYLRLFLLPFYLCLFSASYLKIYIFQKFELFEARALSFCI